MDGVLQPPLALALAGSDPTGGAGLQLDLQVFARFGVHGMAVPTALTIQTTERVRQVLPVFPTAVRDQLATVLGDMLPQAIKVGMLATDDVVLRVADVLEVYPVPRVVDPVLRSSSGTALLERRAWGSLLDRVVRGAALVTPNLDEAEALCGTRDPEAAGRAFLELGARAALIKGGHGEGGADDYLCTSAGGVWLPGKRLPGGAVHGTGCALSAALTALLARGVELGEAASRAKAFVARAIEHSFAPGRGARLLGLDAAAEPPEGSVPRPAVRPRD